MIIHPHPAPLARDPAPKGCGGIKKPLSVISVGLVMKKMGFESIRSKTGKTHHVLERKTIDIDEYQKIRPLEDSNQPF